VTLTVLARRLGFALPFVLPVSVVYGHAVGGVACFLTFAVVFVVIPVLDLLCGVDTDTVAPIDEPTTAWRPWFDGLLYAWVPVQFALVAWGAAAVAGATDALTAIGTTLSVGLVTGATGITVAHELGHRLRRADRALAAALLATVSYGHFQIEHNKGHHVRVATPEDPATAREGESYYAFLPRTLVDGVRGAWEIERARLSAAGLRTVSPWNRMLWIAAAPLAIAAGLTAAVGAAGAAFFFVQSAVAVALLEAVNYVEHYGLRRERRPDGRWERVRPAHSWNSSHRVSNWYLFNLQRHSHHHANVNRRFEQLEHVADAPQLPAGYATMVLLALVPPLWRRTVDPRLQAWRTRSVAA
jgi:alkane 1-monooxygenase